MPDAAELEELLAGGQRVAVDEKFRLAPAARLTADHAVLTALAIF